MSIGDAPTTASETRPLSRPAPTDPGRTMPRPGGRVPPSAAAITRPLLVLLPVVAFLIPSVFLAFARQPVYTSEARLLVAGFDVQAAAIPAFVEASRQLAGTYSRLVETDAIVLPVMEDTKLPRGKVAGHISATSIPDSAIIRVQATGASADAAVRLTTSAANALVDYAKRIGGASDDTLLQDYEKAATELADAQQRQAQAERAVAAASDPNAITAARQALITAQADAATAKLAADRAGGRYTGGGSGSGLQLIGPALDASSDRKSKLQLAIAAPVLLGLAVGVAFATLVVNRGAATARVRAASEPFAARR